MTPRRSAQDAPGQAGTLGVLVALAQDGTAPLLLGVDEDTAVVHRDGAWEACGRRAVRTVEAADGSAVAPAPFVRPGALTRADRRVGACRTGRRRPRP
ncbi:hypothetical protein GC089_07195 [Cellulomonas sp. JZ18]|uniref:hypothetical protein n=1 Tax=Cellulomonas sp. JZ18 TaxID=2654191 RepID=UPI0012D4704E|nr:hypothetical protein [Cellulomonas sp. JZ18]QGQ19055.1 hypothetical protein GC089_07195 [Cellulomonas sp. JZ18]